MKKLMVITVLVATLAALMAGTALAAGPVAPAAQGFGPGNGIHTPGTGMATPGMGASGMMRRGAPEWAGDSEAVQALLGMTAEQLQAERLAGKSLVQIATAKGVGEDELISAILEAKTAKLATLIADGKLTQAQADLMLEHMQTQIKTMVERTSVGPNAGQGQAKAGMRGMMGQGFRGGRGASR